MSVCLTKVEKAQLDALFEPWNRADAPGLAVGVVKDGVTVYRRGLGMASLESHVATSPGTKIRIGSTSKHFTALLALLFQEDGKLDLDAPIRTYIPELAGRDGDISSRLLLQHRGGLRCYLDLGFVSRGLATPSVGEALRTQVRQQGRNFAPGEAMIYNNGGYHLVSIAISRVAGGSFEDQLRLRLFEPLGMTETISLPSDLIILPGMATLHSPSLDGGWRRALFPSNELRGEGAIVSTIDDMVRWMAHLRKRDRFGTAETWRQLTELPVYADGLKGCYALGLMFHDYRGLPTLHHAGGVFGGLSQMLTFPNHGLDIVILANGGLGADPTSLAEQVADIVLADSVAKKASPVATSGREELLGRWLSDKGITYDFLDVSGELKVALCGAGRGTHLEADEDGSLSLPPHSIGLVRFDVSKAGDGSVIAWFGGESSSCRKVNLAETSSDTFRDAAVGRYGSDDSDSTIEIHSEGGVLIARFGDRFGSLELPLHPLGDNAAGTSGGLEGTHHTVLSFEGASHRFSGLRLNSVRTRDLAFARLDL